MSSRGKKTQAQTKRHAIRNSSSFVRKRSQPTKITLGGARLSIAAENWNTHNNNSLIWRKWTGTKSHIVVRLLLLLVLIVISVVVAHSPRARMSHRINFSISRVCQRRRRRWWLWLQLRLRYSGPLFVADSDNVFFVFVYRGSRFAETVAAWLISREMHARSCVRSHIFLPTTISPRRREGDLTWFKRKNNNCEEF